MENCGFIFFLVVLKVAFRVRRRELGFTSPLTSSRRWGSGETQGISLRSSWWEQRVWGIFSSSFVMESLSSDWFSDWIMNWRVKEGEFTLPSPGEHLFALSIQANTYLGDPKRDGIVYGRGKTERPPGGFRCPGECHLIHNMHLNYGSKCFVDCTKWKENELTDVVILVTSLCLT